MLRSLAILVLLGLMGQIWLQANPRSQVAPMIERQMSVEELQCLPVSVGIETAGRAFGLGRTRRAG
jgi:hypothetical protein